MTEKAAVAYPHRRKMDGSLDSICLNCLETIETGERQTDVACLDIHHTCNPTFAAKLSSSALPYSV